LPCRNAKNGGESEDGEIKPFKATGPDKCEAPFWRPSQNPSLYKGKSLMPNTFEETISHGHPAVKIYTGIFQGQPQYLIMGLKKAQAVVDNIDALRKWVDRQEFPHGHNEKIK